MEWVFVNLPFCFVFKLLDALSNVKRCGPAQVCKSFLGFLKEVSKYLYLLFQFLRSEWDSLDVVKVTFRQGALTSPG